MKTTDLNVGQILTDGRAEYLITILDHQAKTIKAQYIGKQGNEYTMHVDDWAAYGFYPKQIAVSILPKAGTWVIQDQSWAKKHRRKEVSHNGKDWVRYELLLDADDFESYEHRREV